MIPERGSWRRIPAAAFDPGTLFDRHAERLRRTVRLRLDRKAGRLDRARRRWEQSLPIRDRAVAQNPGDRQAWKELGSVRAELGRQKEAAAFAKVMELTPESDWWDRNLWWSPDPPGVGEALAAHDAIFARVVRARPRDRMLLIARFHYFGRRGRWKEADEIVNRLIELDPEDGSARHYHRALLLFTGDVEGYRRATREAMAVVQGVRDYDGWFRITGHFEYPRAISIDGPSRNVNISLLCGIAAYREGGYDRTIRELPAVVDSTRHPLRLTLAHLFLAMAHQKLGQSGEARKELDAGRKRLNGLGRATGWRERSGIQEGDLMTYGWTEWVIATVVLREAEGVVVYDPVFPADPFAPTDAGRNP